MLSPLLLLLLLLSPLLLPEAPWNPNSPRGCPCS
jgi:hypothetical protein